MAERRMFAKTIIDSDAFLDMPLSTQALYFHLSMRADDEGFINNPKKLQRMIGASDDDLKILLAKSFIIPFESGIVVIKHWRINNYIQNDRFHPTVYQDEKAQLELKANNSYRLKGVDTECIQDGYKMDTEISIDKNNKSNTIPPYNPPLTKEKMQKPTLEEIEAYCKERNNNVDPKRFFDYYESSNWKDQSGKPVKSWKQKMIAVWEKDNGRNDNNAKNDRPEELKELYEQYSHFPKV